MEKTYSEASQLPQTFNHTRQQCWYRKQAHHIESEEKEEFCFIAMAMECQIERKQAAVYLNKIQTTKL